MQRCKNCHYNTTTKRVDDCWATPKYPVWKVPQYGPVSGADNMKAEIFVRGPISCGIMSTAKFHSYTGGIFAESNFDIKINHEVSILGWGVSDGIEYWIGRNSWGTYWGESGFFRIQMYNNNNGIETDCSWGTVEEKPHYVEVFEKKKEAKVE